MITGLITLELYKVLEKKPIESFRNAYVNLAIPVFAFSEPLPPEKSIDDEANRYEPKEFTAWDTIVINGDLTLGEIFEFLEKKFKLDISLVSVGEKMLYANYLTEHEKRKPKRLSELYSELFKVSEIPKHLNFFELNVIGEDPENDEITVNLALVRVFFREEKEKN